MFEKIGQLAEKTASNVNVSRRGFLGRLGQSALAVAGLFGYAAFASGQSNGYTCCYYYNGFTGGYGTTCVQGTKCPPGAVSKKHVKSCSYCY